MARRKTTLVEALLDLFEEMLPLYVLYLLFLWFTNRASFWRWLIYGILYFAAVVAIALWRRNARLRAEEKWLSDRDLIQKLRGMKPAEFEDYIADLFSRLGFQTRATGQSHDGGIDVIAEKDGKTSYIQCKKFITQEVTVGAVRDFYGALADHVGNGKGYFITTNKFTLEAEKFAEDKPIELVDSFGLLHYIHIADKAGEPIPQLASSRIEKCPQCGGNLVRRNGKRGEFFGCSNFPRCRFTKDLAKI